MLYSRPRRNRYRRRPSRLTALGKAVVGTTASALLALGWASQASRPVPAPASAGSLTEALRPVSAPPHVPPLPRFDALRRSGPTDGPAAVGGPDAAGTTQASSSVQPAGLAPSNPLDSASEPSPPAAPSSALEDGPSAVPSLDAPVDGLDAVAGVEGGAGVAPGRLSAPPASRARFENARIRASAANAGAARIDSPAHQARPRLAEWVDAREVQAAGLVAPDASRFAGFAPGTRLRAEYTLDEKLTESVFDVLRQGRVGRGVAIVIDPRSGRLLAYASTDANVLPVERAYPAASIVKVVTAAAMLEQRANPDGWACTYEGNKYRLSQRRLDPPRRGNRATLEDALATSNNQCFAQWAIHSLGEPRLRRMLDLFGWSGIPAPGHARGRIDRAATRYDLGQLGSGLDGARVTPLHVASLASVLYDGRLAAPRWIERVVDESGQVVAVPAVQPPRRVVGPRTASNLREMMVATTKRGTARRAFRSRRGVPVLGSITVAGKTGNLNGQQPAGRYEWFFGVAPAENPTVGVVVLQVHGRLWWARSSELASNIMKEVFCEGARCRPELAARFTAPPTPRSSPILVSDLEPSSDPAARE